MIKGREIPRKSQALIGYFRKKKKLSTFKKTFSQIGHTCNNIQDVLHFIHFLSEHFELYVEKCTYMLEFLL